MTAHQRYAANLVESFSPADISALAYPAPEDTPEGTGRGRRRPATDTTTLREVHDRVMLHGDTSVKNAWANKLAAAAAEERGDRPATWALALDQFLVEIDPEVTEEHTQDELPGLRSVS